MCPDWTPTDVRWILRTPKVKKNVEVVWQVDYLLPCLTIPAEEGLPIVVWGQRHLDNLKQYRKVTTAR